MPGLRRTRSLSLLVPPAGTAAHMRGQLPGTALLVHRLLKPAAVAEPALRTPYSTGNSQSPLLFRFLPAALLASTVTAPPHITGTPATFICSEAVISGKEGGRE